MSGSVMTDNRRIVGLAGFPGAGKALVSRHLQAKGFVRLRVMDAPRDMLVAAGYVRSSFDDRHTEEGAANLAGSPQRLLQSLIKWGRACCGEALWLQIYANRIRLLTGDVVTDDLKWPEEADVCRSSGGVVLRIDKPGVAAPNEKAAAAVANMKFDAVLVNDRGPRDLCAAVDEWLATAA